MADLKDTSNAIDLSLLRQQAEQSIERLREWSKLLASFQGGEQIAAAQVMQDAADCLVSLTAREREWRDLLVQADSMLSAAGYGRAVTKEEMIELSARIRTAYTRSPVSSSDTA